MRDYVVWLRKDILNIYYIYWFQRSYHFYRHCNWITSGSFWIFFCIHDIISFNSSPSGSWKPNGPRYYYWATASNKLIILRLADSHWQIMTWYDWFRDFEFRWDWSFDVASNTTWKQYWTKMLQMLVRRYADQNKDVRVAFGNFSQLFHKQFYTQIFYKKSFFASMKLLDIQEFVSGYGIRYLYLQPWLYHERCRNR